LVPEILGRRVQLLALHHQDGRIKKPVRCWNTRGIHAVELALIKCDIRRAEQNQGRAAALAHQDSRLFRATLRRFRYDHHIDVIAFKIQPKTIQRI
jgi:hypothetical protein